MKKVTYIILILFISCTKEIDIDTRIQNKIEVPQLGYKIDKNTNWNNTKLPHDLVVASFQNGVTPNENFLGFFYPMTTGDFNNDGWLDLFNSGSSNTNGCIPYSFLIWNPTTNKFDNQNLINDLQQNQSFKSSKDLAVNLNNDNFIDLIIFGYVAEMIPNDQPTKIKLLLSDGKGKYNMTELVTESPTSYHNGGDIGDLNNDGLVDLVVMYGNMMKIFWNNGTYPYFNKNNASTFNPENNNINSIQSNYGNGNGFGEICNECVWRYSWNCKISDVNKDGKNDIVISSNEDERDSISNRILINLGNGRFNKNSIIELPNYRNGNSPWSTNNDYIVDDFNNDGKNDIISISCEEKPKSWDLISYVQQDNGSYKIDNTKIIFDNLKNTRKNVGNPTQLIYYDYNNDGLKDISYVLSGNYFDNDKQGEFKYKSVFIRKGNYFIEEDYYQYDSYAKKLYESLK